MKKGSIQTAKVIERLPHDIAARLFGHLKELKAQQEDIRAACLSLWDAYFQQIIQAQKEGRKGAIGFLCLSWLRSEILCNSRGYRLDAYNEAGYLDPSPISRRWSCDILWKYYDEDMAYLEKAIYKPDKPRLKDPEVKWLRMECAEFYQKLAHGYFLGTIEEIRQLESYHQLKKTKGMKIYSGEYLDRSILIYQAEEAWDEKEQLTEEEEHPIKNGNLGNQDYFLLKQDPGYKNTPQITDWFRQIDKRRLNKKEAKAIPEQTLFKVETAEETVCLDYLNDPFLLMRQEMKEVVALYEPYMKWKEIILLDGKRAECEIYYLPIVEKAECVSPKSQTSIGKTRLKTILLEADKLPDKSIFQLAGSYDQSYTIIRQDLIESLLRRKLTGLSLERIEVI